LSVTVKASATELVAAELRLFPGIFGQFIHAEDNHFLRNGEWTVSQSRHRRCTIRRTIM
jgi:hypothetical protein